MTEGETPAGRASGLSGDLSVLKSLPAPDVDVSETAPPPATLALSLVRRKALWVLGVVGMVGAGLLLIRQRIGQE